jgi:hypothetical protein
MKLEVLAIGLTNLNIQVTGEFFEFAKWETISEHPQVQKRQSKERQGMHVSDENLNGKKLSNEIVLIRGLPGSGKSTEARAMEDHQHFEADMFLDVDGKYVYDTSKVKAAHDWCVAEAKRTLEKGVSVVVSNTFVKLWEMQRYIDLGFPFRIIEMKGKYQNIHGVPQDKIDLMAKGWQLLPPTWDISA